MRVALIADIHGNFVALEAVLANIAKERIHQIICLGDVAATGPQPRQVVERLRAIACLVVMGNADAWLLDPKPSNQTDETSRHLAEIDLWCATQLSHADLEYIRTFQPTVEILLDGNTSLLCFHGSPRSNTEIIESTTPEEALDRMLAGFHATVMAGGHTHTQMLRRHRDTIIINPGSVGLPFERARIPDEQFNNEQQTIAALKTIVFERTKTPEEVYNPSWAEYALVSSIDASLNIELRRVPLDIDAVVQAALDSGMPHSEWWVKDWHK
jgi:putative phosphoesterase